MSPISSTHEIPHTGLFPNNADVPHRPPPIPASIVKRKTSIKLNDNGSVSITDINRWINAVPIVRKYVQSHNESHTENTYMQYRWYDSSQSDKDIQSVLYRIVDDKAKQHIESIYGVLTYNEAQIQFGGQMEHFVNQVASDPMFDPLTQTARLFAIRSIIESKMKTKRRSNINKHRTPRETNKRTCTPVTSAVSNLSESNDGPATHMEKAKETNDKSSSVNSVENEVHAKVVDKVQNLPALTEQDHFLPRTAVRTAQAQPEKELVQNKTQSEDSFDVNIARLEQQISDLRRKKNGNSSVPVTGRNNPNNLLLKSSSNIEDNPATNANVNVFGVRPVQQNISVRSPRSRLPTKKKNINLPNSGLSRDKSKRSSGIRKHNGNVNRNRKPA